jgi:hypothetical protein
MKQKKNKGNIMVTLLPSNGTKARLLFRDSLYWYQVKPFAGEDIYLVTLPGFEPGLPG